MKYFTAYHMDEREDVNALVYASNLKSARKIAKEYSVGKLLVEELSPEEFEELELTEEDLAEAKAKGYYEYDRGT